MRPAGASAAVAAALAPGNLAKITGRAPAAAPDELLLDRPLAALRPAHPPLPGGPSAAIRLLGRIDRSPGRYLGGLLEVVLAALAGFQCTALYGIAVTPPEPPGTVASERFAKPAPPAILSSYDSLFGKAQGGNSPAPAAAGLELHGVRQEGGTGRGSAIISEADGPHQSFGVGEAISPGLVLKEVGPGYATVARHGVDERIAFADFDSPSRTAKTPARVP